LPLGREAPERQPHNTMIFDIILIILLAGFILKGFRMGLIEGIGSIIGIIVGLIVAAHYYLGIAEKLPWLFMNNQTVAQICVFLLIFILVNRAIALVFWVFDKMFKLIAIIPFLKTFNRLLGAALGFIEGVIVIGIVLILLINFTSGDYWKKKVDESRIASFFERVANIVSPLIPKGTEELKNYIPNININKYNIPKFNPPDIEDLLK